MKLQINESTPDRIVRLVLGIVLGAAALAGGIAAPWLYVALPVAAIAVLTGIVGFCPLYAVFGVTTKAGTR